MDIHEQLSALRKRVARIDAKYVANPRDAAQRAFPAPAKPPTRPPVEVPQTFVEEYLSGEVVENELGQHFQSVKRYERHRRYGSFDIADLSELPHDLLESITEGESGSACPTRWAFLDTETTGLAGGSGTYAFLIGVGSIGPEGFTVRQFFMRNYGEEPSMMLALTAYLQQFDILVTYNGKSYDQPLLETRYRMSRLKPPFASMRHVDLLYASRRLWKLRFESCRLVELENKILGIEREGDLPGELIPYVYFEYVRTQEAFRVVPILHHNVCDIVALACLTAIVPFAFKNPEEYRFGHGAEMVGLARWMRQQAGQEEQAAALFRNALQRGLRDDLQVRAMWDLALLEKKKGNLEASIAVLRELVEIPDHPHRHSAYEELAKHFEHREKNYALALQMTKEALAYCGETPELLKRANRLVKKAGSTTSLL